MMRRLMTSLLLVAALNAVALQPDQVPVGTEIASPVRVDKRMAKKILREEDPEFFATAEARRIAGQIMLWQRDTGGWPKNVDMVSPIPDEDKLRILSEKSRRDDSTTDNDATTMQLAFLARMYKADPDPGYKAAFLNGVEYLLSGQYDNGGWPQFWPEMRDYQRYITYNDDAMVNTMRLLRDIADARSPFDSDLADAALVERLRRAFDKGIDCILNTQIKVDGVPTVWCQQHDDVTLEPAKARSYELPSFCSQESVGIVNLLMEIPEPDDRVIRAVMGAVKWFEDNRIHGLTYRRVSVDGKWQALTIENPSDDTPLWARFYDLEQCRPFFCDRDGIPRRSLDEIGEERRNGYSWYNDYPAALIDRYRLWAEKYVR